MRAAPVQDRSVRRQLAWPRPRALGAGWVLWAVRAAALAGLWGAAVATPGFFSSVNLFSVLTNVSFIGCIAVGMTFITLSGNIMSFALGATLGASSIVFMAMLPFELAPAIGGALAFGALLTAAQGWIIGFFRANPIIVSMAVLALIVGSVTFLTGGRGIYPQGEEADVLKGRVGPVPVPVLVFLMLATLGQAILSCTRFGRHVYMIGSNSRAARAAGVEPWPTVTGVYAIAGLCTAVAAVLMGARYGSGDMEHGIGIDYQAISAVLVGGSAIGGGEGSVVRTVLGAFFVAAVQSILLLHGFSTQTQYLTIGIVVLAVVMLQTLASAGR